MYNIICNIIQSIKKDTPLILNLTNEVSMEFVANGLLSLGASPIMTKSLAEIECLVALAAALVINIGTLDDSFVTLCEQACRVANQLGKPIIFDPVGAGASHYRTKTSLNFLKQFNFTVIRGNASEIKALSCSHQNPKGVDSDLLTLDVLESAKKLSAKHRVVIAMSGKTDAVIAGEQVELFTRGSAMMPKITGTGCLLTAIISAFNTSNLSCYTATCAAVVFYGVCGELAAVKAKGPGSFKTFFLDALAQQPEQGDYDAK